MIDDVAAAGADDASSVCKAIVKRDGQVFGKEGKKLLKKESDYADELAERGHDVEVRGTGTKGADFLVDGVPVEYTKLTGTGRNTIVDRTIEKLKRCQADEIHVDFRGIGRTGEDFLRAVNAIKRNDAFTTGKTVRLIGDKSELTLVAP